MKKEEEPEPSSVKPSIEKLEKTILKGGSSLSNKPEKLCGNKRVKFSKFIEQVDFLKQLPIEEDE